MHAKAGCLTPNIECRTNQTVLLHKFIAKMASNLPCVQKFRNKFLPDVIPDVVAYSFSNAHLLNACKSWLPYSKHWMQDKPNCFVAQIHCENGIKFTLCSKVSQQIFTGCSTWYFCTFICLNAFIECMQKLVFELCIVRLCGTHEHKPVQSWIGQREIGNLLHFLKQNFLKIKKKTWRNRGFGLALTVYPQKTCWNHMKGVYEWPLIFFLSQVCSWLEVYNFFLRKILVSHEILGLM